MYRWVASKKADHIPNTGYRNSRTRTILLTVEARSTYNYKQYRLKLWATVNKSHMCLDTQYPPGTLLWWFINQPMYGGQAPKLVKSLNLMSGDLTDYPLTWLCRTLHLHGHLWQMPYKRESAHHVTLMPTDPSLKCIGSGSYQVSPTDAGSHFGSGGRKPGMNHMYVPVWPPKWAGAYSFQNILIFR